ncbi:protein US26 [Panine betaherpesvirus 2]|uniref:Protein US26 n=1 Tax=Panine betaherpesvirus 2 TaxID=188763 RepID=Q8QRT4_9BETA|nr:protein US26 [Panine betaherpesvirus 2]AAM00804.1 protein US26 [Panine betaherpesvirus 2]QXV67922.1 protein US26 [Panine betaherpesvirus 2]
MRQSYRYASGAVVRRTLRGLRKIFTCQDSRQEVRQLVRSYADMNISLPIPAPNGWRLDFVEFQDIFGESAVIDGPDSPWGRLICCEESLEPLGVLQYSSSVLPVLRRPRTSSDEEDSEDEDFFLYVEEIESPSRARLVLLLGRYETMWCLDREQQTLYYLAHSLDDFARHGLLHLEVIYADKMRTPLLTTQPDNMICDLRLHDHNINELQRVACRYRGECIPLRTPGEMTRPLMLCGHADNLKGVWPFICMETPQFHNLLKFFVDCLCCEAMVLGVVGESLPSGLFHAEFVLLADRGCVIFYFDVFRREMWRLANDIDMLFTVGLMKIYQAGRRFHFAVEDAERLEMPGRCPHENFPFWDRFGAVERVRSFQRHHEQRYKWLVRRDRFYSRTDGCYARNSLDEVSGASDVSWDPRVRPDYPQISDLECAKQYWQQLNDHVREQTQRYGPSRRYTMWYGMTSRLERAVKRLQQRIPRRDLMNPSLVSQGLCVYYSDEDEKPEAENGGDSSDEEENQKQRTKSEGGSGTEAEKTTGKNKKVEEDISPAYRRVLTRRAARAAVLEGRPAPKPAMPHPSSYLPFWI